MACRVPLAQGFPHKSGIAVGSEAYRLALEKDRFWPRGGEIRVRFLSKGDRNTEIEQYAKLWEPHANIKFKFVSADPSDIRISLNPTNGWHSLIGKQRPEKSETATMNLAVTKETDWRVLRGLVLHEFGHALGCIHEHLAPTADFEWNKAVVYADLKKSEGWDAAQVQHNLFDKHTQNLTRNSNFDPKSIMIYEIKKTWIKKGNPTAFNSELSQQDKIFIGTIYPFPKK